jgi:malonyl CoA-acyl carrier protein transacylase
MEQLAQVGCDLFIELGPGRVLAGLVKRTMPDSEVVSIADSESMRSAATNIATSF